MSKLRVDGFSISVDGFGAGPGQGLKHPLGVGGEALHEWLTSTPTFYTMQGRVGGTPGIDEKFAKRGFQNIDAWIMGRNMFGPIRGSWPDENWRGWWGENPPYHVPVFVLTHHKRPPLKMDGDTTFYFVTDGKESALAEAKKAAKGKDIRLGGGVSTIREYLKGGSVDEIHIAISPVLLGRGEHLLSGIDLVQLGYRVVEHVPSAKATHIVLSKQYRC